MCKFKSALILKDDVFVPDYDSHDAMLQELKIADTQANAESKFVRVELFPKDGNMFSPIDTWTYHVDQDILPNWYVEEVDKKRVIAAIKNWADKHIIVEKQNVRLNSGTYYVKNSTVMACDSATVKAHGNATVTAYSNSTVTACDSATVKAYDKSTVEAWGNSTVEAHGNATVEAYDKSTVEAWGNSTVEAHGNATVEAHGNATVVIPGWSSNSRENVIISENATIKDCKTQTIWQSGDWKIEIVKGE